MSSNEEQRYGAMQKENDYTYFNPKPKPSKHFFKSTPSFSVILFTTISTSSLTSSHLPLPSLPLPLANTTPFQSSNTLTRLFRGTFVASSYTFTSVLKGYGVCMALREGLEFGFLGSARKVFDEMSVRSLVSWTAVIVGYARCGDMSEARKLFDVIPDRDIAAFNVMIDGMVHGYCEDGDVVAARFMFDRMPIKNVLSWNAMIRGYCDNRRPRDALKLFCEMRGSLDVEMNKVTKNGNIFLLTMQNVFLLLSISVSKTSVGGFRKTANINYHFF
uniref:Pentatricopeptide repeat-containing protein At2g44880-like n=1 Tax=Cicer arietinum TaxID=3827 RepID=A0A1S3DUY5_CICAR|nr:pentatricopeptide repeat-containing protein At2g44880-like [Cicer arietinum]